MFDGAKMYNEIPNKIKQRDKLNFFKDNCDEFVRMRYVMIYTLKLIVILSSFWNSNKEAKTKTPREWFLPVLPLKVLFV